MALSNYAEAAILDHFFSEGASPSQTSYWVALFTSATGDDGSGSEVTTADWSNYSRANVDATSASGIFSAAAASGNAQVVGNESEIDFGTAVIVDENGVSHIAVMTAAEAGNSIYHGALSSVKTISDGDPVKIPASSLSMSLS